MAAQPAAAQTQGSRSLADRASEASWKSTGGYEEAARHPALPGFSAAPSCRCGQYFPTSSHMLCLQRGLWTAMVEHRLLCQV